MSEQLTATFNVDIVGLSNRICRCVDEIQHFASSNTSEVYPADLTRLKSYIDGLRTYHDTVQQLERMDYVETNSRLEPLRPLPTKVELENESLNDVNNLLRRQYAELTHSQSSRDSSKLNKYDSARFIQSVDRMTALIKDYIEVIVPLDFPNSSPRTAAVGEGKTGI